MPCGGITWLNAPYCRPQIHAFTQQRDLIASLSASPRGLIIPFAYHHSSRAFANCITPMRRLNRRPVMSVSCLQHVATDARICQETASMSAVSARYRTEYRMKQPITFRIDLNLRRQAGEAEAKYHRCVTKFNADAYVAPRSRIKSNLRLCFRLHPASRHADIARVIIIMVNLIRATLQRRYRLCMQINVNGASRVSAKLKQFQAE